MFLLSFYYEDVSRQDPLLKLNHANVMEVPRSCEIRVVPTPSDFRIQNGKLVMDIPRSQKFIQRKPQHQVSKSNPFDKDGGYVSELARHSSLRGQGMSFRISTIIFLLDSLVKIKENSIQFSMETKFCEFSPELEDHFEIFEHIRGTQDENLSSWSGFFQQDGA
ncbi:hypothetical protein MKX01_036243 [Papaver californicum]|nr:hypothetical protein MKX01_036243 [Papaver californicum]